MARKNYAPSVVYSADAHREFVNGFRKRKQERRLIAQAMAVEKKKQELREQRKQRRQFFRSRAQLIHSDSEADETPQDPARVKEVTEYQGVNGTVTAIVQPMQIGTLAPRPTPRAANNSKPVAGSQHPSRATGKAQMSKNTVSTTTLKLGVAKQPRKGGNRRISYSHTLSKPNLRKAKVQRRREDRKRVSGAY